MIFGRWALYFSPDQVHAFRKAGLRYELAGSFDEQRVAEFEHLVKSIGNTPIDILVDWVEENFNTDTIPHVWGRDRQRLLQRKQDQINRNTEYRQAVFLGREGQGRKDDRYLFMSLANPERFKPWLPLLMRHQAAIRGIHSVSQFIPALAHRLGTPDHALITTLSFGTQVRQSYMQAGKLQFSRQFLAPNPSPETMAAQIAAETEKTRTYLNTKRLMPREDALDVFVLASQALHPQLEARCQDTALVRYQFLALEDIRPRLGLAADAPGGAETLFLALLRHQRPRTSYAPPSTTLYYRYWQAGMAIFLLGAATLAGAAAIAGLNFKAADEQQQLAARWAREADDLQRQIDAQKKNGAADLPPEEIIRRGQIQEGLEALAASPRPEMRQLGAILAGHPQIRLHKLSWERGPAPPTQAAPASDAGAVNTLAGVFPPPDPAPPTTLQIEGEVWPFSGDYTAAIGAIDSLVADLAHRADIRATVLAHPVNLDAQKGTRGSITAKAGERANFRLRLDFPPAGKPGRAS